MDASDVSLAGEVHKSHSVLPQGSKHPFAGCSNSAELCDVCIDVKTTEAEILALQIRLDALHGKHQALLVLQNSVHDSLTTKLPPELISRIFVACCRPYSAHCEDDNTPLILAFVCSAWRRIALSTIELWAEVYVDLARADLYSVGFQLQRCQNMPFAVHVCTSAQYLTPANEFISSEDLSAARSIINLIRSRLESVKFFIVELPAPLLRLFDHQSLPSKCDLFELHVHCLSDFLFTGLSPKVHLADRSTARKVVTNQYHTSQLQLKWASVQNLVMLGGPICASLAALALASRVSEVEICVAGENSAESPPHPRPVVRQSLKKLTIVDDMTAYGVLEGLSAPSLTTLNLEGITFRSSLIHILRFLPRSSENLINLNIEILGDFEYTALAAILRETPNITSLSITHLSGTRQALDELSGHMNVDLNTTPAPPVLRKLQKLELRLGHPLLDWSAFLDMCDSRQRRSDPSIIIDFSENDVSTAQLQIISLHLTDEARSGLSSDHLDRIAEMRQRGCSIQVERI